MNSTDWLTNWLIEWFLFPPNHSPLPLKLLITRRVVLSVVLQWCGSLRCWPDQWSNDKTCKNAHTRNKQPFFVSEAEVFNSICTGLGIMFSMLTHTHILSAVYSFPVVRLDWLFSVRSQRWYCNLSRPDMKDEGTSWSSKRMSWSSKRKDEALCRRALGSTWATPWVRYHEGPHTTIAWKRAPCDCSSLLWDIEYGTCCMEALPPGWHQDRAHLWHRWEIGRICTNILPEGVWFAWERFRFLCFE